MLLTFTPGTRNQNATAVNPAANDPILKTISLGLVNQTKQWYWVSTGLLLLLLLCPRGFAQQPIELEFEASDNPPTRHSDRSNLPLSSTSGNSSQNEDVRYYQDYQSAPAVRVQPAAVPQSPATVPGRLLILPPPRLLETSRRQKTPRSKIPRSTLPRSASSLASESPPAPMEFGAPLPTNPTATPESIPIAVPAANRQLEWGAVTPPPQATTFRTPSPPQATTTIGTPPPPAQLTSSGVAALPNTTANLAIPVTAVQVLGVGEDLESIVLEAVRTRPGGEASELQLQRDVESILQTGFFANARASFSDTPSGLGVIFQVDPIVVQSLSLTGAQVLPLEVANASFQDQLGAAINPILLRQGGENINRWYAENGYALGQVLAVRPRRDGAIAIEVTEGKVSNVTFRFVDKEGQTTDKKGKLIKGRTRESFLRRETQLKSGQIFRQDIVNQDIQTLSKLGLFNFVDVALEAETDGTSVVYILNEAASRSINFGGGVNSGEGVFGTANYKDINVGGIGQQFDTTIRVSSLGPQFNSRFTSPYRDSQPNRLGYEINAFRSRLLSATFDDRVRLPNDDRVREGRFGGRVALMRPVNDEWDGELAFNYTRISIRDSEGDLFTRDELGNPLTVSGTGVDDLATISFAVGQDRRDNPINPSRGSQVRLSTEQSIPVGSGDIVMNRLRANYAQYVPVRLLSRNNHRPENPEVFAFNVQGGTAIGELPPYEAFNLGGLNSVRGYGEDDVGSGRSFFLLSGEYRFPIIQWLGGVLFTDFATDLGSGDTVLGEPAEVRDKPGTGFGVGAGLRANSPVGLIRVDFGFSDEGESRLRFGFGQRF